MDLLLSFEDGKISGEGSDRVGVSIVIGRYSPANGECWWLKTYLSAHHITYRGFREGAGIWGTWEIGSAWKGGFHIWPLGEEPEDEAAAMIEESAAPVEARATKQI